MRKTFASLTLFWQASSEALSACGIKAAGSRGGTTTDQKNMNAKYISLFAEKVLGQPLIPSDSHDEEGAMMTKKQEWYFVPHTNDPVRGRPTIRHPEGVLTDRPRWGLEMVQSYPGGYWEPPEYDLGEIDRFDSLEKAIEGAAVYALRQQIAEHGAYCQHLDNLENPPPYEDWNELA